MKMKFEELRYLAFEGGGGKGAVYKGAIVALEDLFHDWWKNGAWLKLVSGELVSAGPNEADRGAGTSILDYHERGGGLRIKGISGASAGAITAFPLALGLTSDDIETILTSYRFAEEFLPNHKLNEGRYRMVGMDRDGKAQLLVAEDHMRKLGEENIAYYQVQLFGGVDAAGRNGAKGGIRSLVVAGAISAIFTGLIEQWGIIRQIARTVGGYLEKINYLKQASTWLKGNVVQELWTQVFENRNLVRFLTSFTPVPLNLGLKQILRIKPLDRLPWGPKHQRKIKGVLPADNLVAAVANLLWDRGIYGGFEVRELFFKIVLLAISQDTHFARRLSQSEGLLKEIGLSGENIRRFTVTFDDHFEIQRPEDAEARGTLERLKLLQARLTFRELHAITGVHLAICVTNATTAQPIYFSHYFTPDFPVLEAIGASMTFPGAFKPVYNEANVLLHAEGGDGSNRTFLNPADFVKFTPHGSGVRLFKESFSMREYNHHLAVVLAYVRETAAPAISVNGNLSFRSFLPYLRRIIDEDSFEAPFEHASVSYSGSYMRALCYFYYNSAFKGLLFDGGATNNLPASIFTFVPRSPDKSRPGSSPEARSGAPGPPAGRSDAAGPREEQPEAADPSGPRTEAAAPIQDLNVKKSTLSLKLDNSFPPEVLKEAFELLKHDPKILSSDDDAAHLGFVGRLLRGRQVAKALKGLRQRSPLSSPAWKKVSGELVKEYRRTLGGFTPWNRDMNIVSALLTALQFGFGQGQIENVSDNDYIIPCYCYGIDTLDFDLTSDEMQPLVDLAVEASEKDVRTYFGREENAASSR